MVDVFIFMPAVHRSLATGKDGVIVLSLFTRSFVSGGCGPAAGAGDPPEASWSLSSDLSSHFRSILRRGADQLHAPCQETSRCVGGMKKRNETSNYIHGQTNIV